MAILLIFQLLVVLSIIGYVIYYINKQASLHDSRNFQEISRLLQCDIRERGKKSLADLLIPGYQPEVIFRISYSNMNFIVSCLNRREGRIFVVEAKANLKLSPMIISSSSEGLSSPKHVELSNKKFFAETDRIDIISDVCRGVNVYHSLRHLLMKFNKIIVKDNTVKMAKRWDPEDTKPRPVMKLLDNVAVFAQYVKS